MSAVGALVYCGIAVMCFVLIRPRKDAWEIGLSGAVCLSILWPLFLLMAADWGFGDLVDKLQDFLTERIKRSLSREKV